MKQFAYFFRQGPVDLSEEQQKRRIDEVRDWAVLRQTEGRRLEPKILTVDSHHVAPVALSPLQLASEWPLGAVDFLEARDLNEAVQIAQTHPAINYGISIEVREWTVPSAAPLAGANR